MADPDFDLGTPSSLLFDKIAVPPSGAASNPPGCQSVCFDNVHNRMYTLQSYDGAAGNLYLSWLDMAKNGATQPQYMTLLGFDHGQQFGVVIDGNDTWIWVGCDAVLSSSGNAFGSKIARFRWEAGSTINSHTASAQVLTKYDLKPGSIGLGCCIDGDTLLLNFNDPTSNAPCIQPYSVTDIIAHGNAAAPLGAAIRLMSYVPTFQGRTVYGDYCYSITGPGKASYCSDAPDIHIYWQNIWNGISGSSITRAGLALPRREPEGMAIQAVGGTHRLVYTFATRKDCTGTGKNLISLYYIPDTPVGGAPAIPAVASRAHGGPLGCGTYRVYVYDRGGADRIGEITPLSRVQWSRVRDDISNAIVNTVGFGPDCCELLESIRSMRHELVIFRDGVRVWEGPITRVAYQADEVEIEARDIMQYVYRRIFRLGYDHRYKAGPKGPDGKPTYINYPHGNPVVSTVGSILNSVLKTTHIPVPDDPAEPEEFTFGYDPNILKYIHIYPHTAAGDAHEARQVLPFSMTAWELIDDLAANSGIDYTVLGRSILVWDTSYAIGKTTVLTDEAFMANPIVTEYGMSFATFSAVTDGNGYYGVYGGIDSYYGMVEILNSSYTSTIAPDKTAFSSWTQVQKAHNAYIEAFGAYHAYPCLSSAEQARLARYYRERYTHGVLPKRQKQLDALIKPLADRVKTCSTLKTRQTKRYNEWQAANKSYDKYQEKINSYVATLSSQAQRNMSGRRTVLTDQKTGAVLKNSKGQTLNGGAPVVVRIPDNTQLNPDVMLGINDLVPGIWIPLRSTATCQQVQQWQKLDNVTVSFDTQTPEQVQVTMSLAPNGGQDFDAIPAPETEDDGGV